MRLIFAGTPAFAACSLGSVLEAGHEVALVLTQPDRPAGRGLKPAPREVKALASARRLHVEQPANLKDPATIEQLRALNAQVMVVAAYGLILPRTVLESFPLGCINVHGSLLPRWRGAAPIQRAILAGDARTGVCIMQMEAGLDTGPVLLSEALDIDPRDNAQSLHDRLAELGSRCLCRALAALEAGGLPAHTQSAQGVTYATKITKEEAILDWHEDAGSLERRVRALNPAPVARSALGPEVLKVWQATALPLQTGGAGPGEIVAVTADAVTVACGQGVLRLEVLQRAGGRPLPVAQFVNGFPLGAGMRLGA